LASVYDLSLVDLEAVVVGCRQAGCLADCAVDIHDLTAGAAYEVMVVVPDP